MWPPARVLAGQRARVRAIGDLMGRKSPIYGYVVNNLGCSYSHWRDGAGHRGGGANDGPTRRDETRAGIPARPLASYTLRPLLLAKSSAKLPLNGGKDRLLRRLDLAIRQRALWRLKDHGEAQTLLALWDAVAGIDVEEP